MKHVRVILGWMLAGAVVSLGVSWGLLWLPGVVTEDRGYVPSISDADVAWWTDLAPDRFMPPPGGVYDELTHPGMRCRRVYNAAASEVVFLREVRWGFPAPAFRGLQWSYGLHYTFRDTSRWMIRFEYPVTGLRQRLLTGNEIPSRPMPSGLLVNSLVSALGLWLVVSMVRLIVRTARRRRGCCPRCAYNLTHADHVACPECGHELSIPE